MYKQENTFPICMFIILFDNLLVCIYSDFFLENWPSNGLYRIV